MKFLNSAGILALGTGMAVAATIGVSIVPLDNSLQTLLRQGIEARAAEVGTAMQIEDAQNDSARQFDQVNNFIANGVDAIILTLVDTAASPALSRAAADAGVPDAVFANNDESALGAILALKAAKVPMEDVVVVGLDATADALQFMQAGDLDVTVFQNARAQGGGGVDAALKLAKGEAVDKIVDVPFELVTPANMADYIGRN